MNIKDVNKAKEALRKDRIAVLGGFGSKVEQVVPDVTKYNRKTKHKKS